MKVKTPRHDELLEMLAAGKYGWKTHFEEAIQLAEKLEFENIALQQQIEAMKCCMNCGNNNGLGLCILKSQEEWRECFDGNYAKWRLRE